MLKKSASVVFIASFVSSHPCTDDLYKVHHHHHRRHHHHHYGTCSGSFFPDQSACHKKITNSRTVCTMIALWKYRIVLPEQVVAIVKELDLQGWNQQMLSFSKRCMDTVWFAITRSPINSLWVGVSDTSRVYSVFSSYWSSRHPVYLELVDCLWKPIFSIFNIYSSKQPNLIFQ